MYSDRQGAKLWFRAATICYCLETGGRRSMASIPKEYPVEAVFFPALENRMRCRPAVKAWVPDSRVPDGESPPLGRLAP